MTLKNRDEWGKIVRDAWIKWALTQENPKPSWLVPYENLSEPDKEADRQIAEGILQALAIKINPERIYLAEKKARGLMEIEEYKKFITIQACFFGILQETTGEHQLYE